jgi:hypothetical protein
LLVPVFYAIFVLDLRIVAWDTHPEPDAVPQVKPESLGEVAGV